MEKAKRCCLYILGILDKLSKSITVSHGETSTTKLFHEGDFLIFETNENVEIKLEGIGKAIKVDLHQKSCGSQEFMLASNVSCLLLYAEELENVFINDLNDSNIMGHRGTGQENIYTTKERFENKSIGEELYYENTISSFKKAWEKGANWVEMDIQLTKNEVPVIFHDFDLDIENEKSGINELEDDKFLNFFKGPKDDIPTSLEAIFSRIPKGLGLNLEIKYPNPVETKQYNLKDLIPTDAFVKKILSVLVKQKARRICFSSFHPLITLYLRIRLPQSLVMFITHHKFLAHESNTIEEIVSFCSQAGLNGLVMDYKSIKQRPEEIRKMCKENNLKLFVYGSEVSDKYTQNSLLKTIGVDGIITDNILN